MSRDPAAALQYGRQSKTPSQKRKTKINMTFKEWECSLFVFFGLLGRDSGRRSKKDITLKEGLVGTYLH